MTIGAEALTGDDKKIENEQMKTYTITVFTRFHQKRRHMYTNHSIYCILPPHLFREMRSKWHSRTARKRSANNYLDRTIPSSTSNHEGNCKIHGHRSSGGKHRTIYDAKHGSKLPGVVVRKEGDPASSDLAVNEAYDGSGITYDLYFNIYGRNSLDNNGLKLEFHCPLPERLR